ncbi:migration and invasion-inhibitory protein [Pseudophryne corroboree]|uniref:migration and invasion-inhibitory protein n=1 Tax=Pseudophryne corroboree TaxID=495146 RepID=UPI003081E839
MASYNQVEELRLLNKSLLKRLTIKQDAVRKQLSGDCSAPSVVPGGAVAKDWNEETALNGFGQFHMKKSLFGDQDTDVLSTECSSTAARRALCPPRKSAGMRQSSVDAHSQPDDRGMPGRDSSAGVITIGSPIRRLSVLNSTAVTHPSDVGDTRAFSLEYIDRLVDEGNLRSREHRTPKSILLTPNRTSKRDPGHVTFPSEDPATHVDQRSARALLGYDWIAGLLEVNSPITNQSDQFFSEIGEFRRVNREECVHRCFSESGAQDSEEEEEVDVSLDTHRCVYCYRVNQRLFTSPVGPESACPICKKRRGRRHAALDEPAYIRVSIPRSTLLPPYKYRAHRRKSFDPTDSVALPSHCLAGWENAVPSCDLRVTSLDLKTSVDPSVVTSGAAGDLSMDSASYYASRARSENLLNMSRSIVFHHSKAV